VVQPDLDASRRYPAAKRLLDLPLVWAERDPAAPALTMVGGETWSRARLLSEVAAVQQWLTESGVQPGDRVAILCLNSQRMVASYLAAIGLGALAVPLNTAWKSENFADVLRHAEVKVMIADAEFTKLLPVGQDTDGIRCLVNDTDAPQEWPHAPRDLHVQNVGGGKGPAQIIYTSGTTGFSKGVVTSHRAIINSAWHCAAIFHEATEEMRLYTSMPLFHCGAQQVSLWTSLTSGAHLVINSRFSASTWWQQMRDYKIDHFNYIGEMLSILAARPPSDEDRAHGVSLAVGGGFKTVWEEFEERFGVGIVEMYGSSETFSGCVSYRPGRGRAWTCGKALPFVEVRIAGPDGSEQETGERGEIQIRPTRRELLFTEYYKNDEANNAAWKDGWFCTKDVGSLDADGFLTFYERLSDLIRHKGENISAAYIESIMKQLDGVEEVVAVPVPSLLGEQDVMIAVTGGPQLTASDVFAFAEDRLPAYAVPEYVLVADSFPKTETMRIKRSEVASRASESVRRERSQH
jgi:crotonobetaine/carnitine-CoA ligase